MKLRFWTSEDITELSEILNPKIRGWINYYGRFCRSEMRPVFKYINKILLKWAMKKHKKLKRSKNKAKDWLARIAKINPKLFVHWEKGIISY